MTNHRSSLPILLTLVLLFAPFAAAEEHKEWEYEIEVGSSEVSIEMRSESGDDEQAVNFYYARDDAAVEFAYEAENGSSETEAETEVQFHQLVEYEDGNGNGKYDVGEEIVSAFHLSDGEEESLTDDADEATWGAIQQSSVISDNGVSGTKFSSTANIGGGQLRFDFYVFGDEASLGAAGVEATEIKLDIIIKDYPYQSESSALALFLEVEAEAEIEDDDDVDSDEEGVAAGTGGLRLRFAWKDFATVDGVDMDVKTTKISSSSSQGSGELENEELIVLSYPRGTEIVHDPTMGLATASDSNNIPAPGAVLLIGVLAAAIILRRR